MNHIELQQIREALGVGPVAFCERYLACPYGTGKYYLSGARDIPRHAEMLAKIWLDARERGDADRLLSITS